MELQLGAHEIDIDTMEGYVAFAVFEPVDVGAESLREVLDSANYELSGAEIRAIGTIVTDGDATAFDIRDSGERLPARADRPVGWQGPLHLRLDGGAWTEI